MNGLAKKFFLTYSEKKPSDFEYIIPHFKIIITIKNPQASLLMPIKFYHVNNAFI